MSHVATRHEVCKQKPVKAFGPSGDRRRNFSIESAEYLAERRSVIAVRNRRGQILTIHFYGESSVPLKARLKAGTRYTYREVLQAGCTWTMKGLPYHAMDASTGFCEQPEVIDSHIRALFQAVPLSIAAREPKKLAPVVSIEAGRRKAVKRPVTAKVIAFPVKKAA